MNQPADPARSPDPDRPVANDPAPPDAADPAPADPARPAPPEPRGHTLALDRPLAFFDIETTGLNTFQDRIVELAIVILRPDGTADPPRARRFNPEVPIPADAARIHGITDADVADEAPFRRRARSLAKLLEPCDLAGFNMRSFDLPMLAAEFERAGVEFDVEGRRLVDVQHIFHKEEPRNLSAAVRFYLGRDHEGAHGAGADTQATVDVLIAQLARYGNLPKDMGELHDYCDAVGRYRTPFDRWFDRTSDGPRFRKGKHRGELLREVARMHPDYLDWMLGAEDMPRAVLDPVREALAQPKRTRTQ